VLATGRLTGEASLMILAPLARVVTSVGGGLLEVRCAGEGVKLARGSERGVRMRRGWLEGSHDKKFRGCWLEGEGGAVPLVFWLPAGIPVLHQTKGGTVSASTRVCRSTINH